MLQICSSVQLIYNCGCDPKSALFALLSGRVHDALMALVSMLQIL